MEFKNQKGQAVLVVLLSLAVVLVVVMFVVSRSITDISLSSKEEGSLRAFSAAEAGIERALVIGSYQAGEFGDASFSGSVTNFAEGSDKETYPISLKSGESATFWFSRPNESTHFTGRYIKLCWGDVGTLNNDLKTPAVEFTVYYTSTANNLTTLKVARAVFDPSSRASTNHFTAASSGTCTIGDENFQFYTTSNIDLLSLGITGWATPGVLQYATAKILYNDTVAHKVGIDVSSTGSTLPSQGVKIESNGSYGDANRSIEVYQLHPIAPSIFENAIFSSGGITKP
jgi:hypothetical protein